MITSVLREAKKPRPTVQSIVQRVEHSLGRRVVMHKAELHQLERMSRCGTGELGLVRRECPEPGPGHYVAEYGAPCKKRLCVPCAGSLIAAFMRVFDSIVLPCPVHHVVVTLWGCLREVWKANRKLVTQIMFDAAGGALTRLLGDERHLGATAGVMGVLHTTSESGRHHLHLHFITTAGGLDADGKWRECKPGWLVPKRAFRLLYRGLFITALSNAHKEGSLHLPSGMTAVAFYKLLGDLRHRKWNVFVGRRRDDPRPLALYVASRAYGGPVRDHQIVSVVGRHVTFYVERSAKRLARQLRRGIRARVRTLTLRGFVRRILKHWLPKQTRAVRYFGLYASGRRVALDAARKAIGVKAKAPAAPVDPTCGKCGRRIETRRSPPLAHPLRQCVHAPRRVHAARRRVGGVAARASPA
jgi:hypothetical protein